MGKHLLVTNDFPPKVGGIQNYLYELWSRLDPSSFVVVTTSHPEAKQFDLEQRFKIVRLHRRVLLPTRSLAKDIQDLAIVNKAEFIIWDPALPVGLLAPTMGIPYAVVLHGAELTIPAHLPIASMRLRKVLGGAEFVVVAGQYPKSEIDHLFSKKMANGPDILEVPPGVDGSRFRVLAQEERKRFREQLGISETDFLLCSVSRLVPRKGIDTLVEAAGLLRNTYPSLKVLIAGTGRDQNRLAALIERRKAPVRLLGRISEEELPTLLGSSDSFAMLCRSRWAGLEQEGFGIVFLEASSCGIPVIAGYSGGSCEAVVNQETGFVIYKPKSARRTAEAISMLIEDEELRRNMGTKGRVRATDLFSYDILSVRLQNYLDKVV
jgi:phosphatidylinositol alpha-1,6-mannosyltransferase